jgi:type VI protein secretion system component VasF
MSEHQRPVDSVVEPKSAGPDQHEERPRRRVPAWKLVVALLVLGTLVWIVMRQSF